MILYVTLSNLENATESLEALLITEIIWIKSGSNATYYVVSNNACGQSIDSITALIFGYSGSAFGDTAFVLVILLKYMHLME